jgi:putative transposase
MNEPKTYYRRHLPHYQPPEGATYHVVFRLKGSLPAKAIEELRAESEEAERGLEKTKEGKDKIRLLRELRWTYFERFDVLLDANSTGPLWLKEPEVAEIVKEALHYRDDKVYGLLAFCIMPNHVHMVFELVSRTDCPTYPVTEILRKLKWNTALRTNRALHRRGAFWQDESYDHVIRDGNELERTIWYVLENPVKAGSVQSWKQWPWTYLKPDLL